MSRSMMAALLTIDMVSENTKAEIAKLPEESVDFLRKFLRKSRQPEVANMLDLLQPRAEAG